MGAISGIIGGSGTLSGKIQSPERLSGRIQNAEKVYVKELQFANHYEFPTLGNASCLYIAVDEDRIYRFDEEQRGYICVGSNIENLEAIQVKLKEE